MSTFISRTITLCLSPHCLTTPLQLSQKLENTEENPFLLITDEQYDHSVSSECYTWSRATMSRRARIRGQIVPHNVAYGADESVDGVFLCSERTPSQCTSQSPSQCTAVPLSHTPTSSNPFVQNPRILYIINYHTGPPLRLIACSLNNRGNPLCSDYSTLC